MGRLCNAAQNQKLKSRARIKHGMNKKCASILNARCKYKGREMLLFARNICVTASSHLSCRQAGNTEQRTKAIFEQVVLLQRQNKNRER